MIKKLSFRGVLICSLAALSGGLLFYTSQSVQRAEGDLRVVQRNILKEQETIRVLQAEWAYLNSPARLESLAAEFLELRSPNAEQIMPEASSLPESVVLEVKPRGFQDVSFPAPDAESSEPAASEIFITPPKKPSRETLNRPVRKETVAKKSFDALLNELGQDGGAQ